MPNWNPQLTIITLLFAFYVPLGYPKILPFCEDYVCSPKSLDVGFKMRVYEETTEGALEALIPVVSEPPQKCANFLQPPDLVPKDSIPWAAVVSHGWCEDGKPFDTIVASASTSNGKDFSAKHKMHMLLESLEFSQFATPLSIPKNYGDFGRSGCVDSDGYSIGTLPSRSLGCFSLLIMKAANASGDDAEKVALFYSGRLILNAIPMQNGLADFLANYRTIGQRGIRSDLICADFFPSTKEPVILEDYCVRETRPGIHFRLCCCSQAMDESRRCQVHTNPINLPNSTQNEGPDVASKPKPTEFRCIYGEFSSEENSLKLDTDSTILDSFAELKPFCSIRYSAMLVDGQKAVYNFSQGSEPPLSSIESLIKNVDEELLCVSIKDDGCPQIAKDRNTTELRIYCQCKAHYCNVDKKSELIIQRLREWDEYRCEGRGAVMRNIAKNSEKCVYYLDPNSGEIYDLDVAAAAYQISDPSQQLSAEVTRYSYWMELGCMENPDIPIRAFDAIECEIEAIGKRECVKNVKYESPGCQTRFMTGAGLRTSIYFLDKFYLRDTNATNRCYASFIMPDPNNVTLQSGPADELSLEDQRECINGSSSEGHFSLLFHSGNRTIFCCHSGLCDDARPDLRNELQKLLLPRDEVDIRAIVDQQPERQNCFAVPQRRRPLNEEEPENIVKCQNFQILATEINEKYSTDLDNIRFEFCRENPEKNRCYDGASRTINRQFCCCNGGDSCQMRIHWGRPIGSFISGRNITHVY